MKLRNSIAVLIYFLSFAGSALVSVASESLQGATSSEGVNEIPIFYMATVAPDGQLIAVGRRPFVVVKLNPLNGRWTVISNSTHGSGPIPENPLWGIALLPDGRIVSATQLDSFTPRSIIVIDPTTGNRSVLSQQGVRGEGPGFSMVDSIVVSQGQLFVTDKGSHNAVIQVDPATGDRKILSDAQHGLGPLLGSPLGITGREDGFLYVVYARQPKAIAGVHPKTGDRFVISDTTQGAGPSFREPWRVVLLPDQRLAVADVQEKAIFVVNINNGDRAILTGPNRGQGPGLTYPFSLLYHSNGYLVVFDPFQGIIFRVDVLTGDRAFISKR